VHLPAGTEMAMPGDNIALAVGAGVVASIIE
jgi:hypothetical protein